jgi:hypothetical protein
VESLQVSGRRQSAVLLTVSTTYSSLLETEICSTLLDTSAVVTTSCIFRQLLAVRMEVFVILLSHTEMLGADP